MPSSCSRSVFGCDEQYTSSEIQSENILTLYVRAGLISQINQRKYGVFLLYADGDQNLRPNYPCSRYLFKVINLNQCYRGISSQRHTVGHFLLYTMASPLGQISRFLFL